MEKNQVRPRSTSIAILGSLTRNLDLEMLSTRGYGEEERG